jgi:hypothetical protein
VAQKIQELNDLLNVERRRSAQQQLTLKEQLRDERKKHEQELKVVKESAARVAKDRANQKTRLRTAKLEDQNRALERNNSRQAEELKILNDKGSILENFISAEKNLHNFSSSYLG